MEVNCEERTTHGEPPPSNPPQPATQVLSYPLLHTFKNYTLGGGGNDMVLKREISKGSAHFCCKSFGFAGHMWSLIIHTHTYTHTPFLILKPLIL